MSMLINLTKVLPVLRKAMSEWYKKWYNVDLDPDTEIYH
jgi:Aspartate/tyrosine/aromatic aminotransferase